MTVLMYKEVNGTIVDVKEVDESRVAIYESPALGYVQYAGAPTTIPAQPPYTFDANGNIVADTAKILSDIKIDKIKWFYENYQAEIQADIAYMNHMFQADEESQTLMSKVISAGAVPPDFYWRSHDPINGDVNVPITFSELQGLAQAILLRGQPLFTKVQTLKAKVLAANTQEAIDMIVW